MLHKETVETSTLELLKSLQSEPILAPFNLVGGTSLALRLGHRKSVDLDLFSKEDFDLQEVKELLVNKYNLKVGYEKGKTLKGFIGKVMVDFIRYGYPHIQPIETEEGIRLESLPDIVAMKLSSICDNGSRIKDFIDIAYLSNLYSFGEMLQFYTQKFPSSNPIVPTKSLVYFDDINFDEELIVLFYSVLNYLSQEFKFSVRPAFGYDLLRPETIQSMIESGKGVRILRQNRRKYFTDEMVQLWNLLFTFFEQSQYVQSKDNDDEQAMLVREFNLVFEDMIDLLIGDSSLPSGLKEQKDGKIIDHLYRDSSLIEDKKQIYFIGDSKYYKDENDIGPNSIYKQFTYAKNVIQYNIDFFNHQPNEFEQENLQYRDNTTEGYNITPNYFIRGHLQAGQLNNYSDSNLQLVSVDGKNYKISYHFENRLFDRDTLILQTYNINFLFVLACYVQGAGEHTQKIRAIFRENIKSVLQTQYDFFAIKPKVQHEAEQFLHDNFQQVLGKVIAPYDASTNCMALALDQTADNTATLDLIDQYFYRQPIPKDHLDITPDTLFGANEQTRLFAETPVIDKNLKCIISAQVRKDDKQFDLFNLGEATEYTMESVPSVSLMSIKYLMPMPAYNVRGYYEVTDMKFSPKTGGMKFKLGQFHPLGDTPVNIAGKMRHVHSLYLFLKNSSKKDTSFNIGLNSFQGRFK